MTRGPRAASMAAVAHALLAQGARPVTRRELAEVSKVSVPTIAAAIAGLRAREVLEASSLRFGRGCGYVIGVALGADSCRAALIDANGALVRPHSRELPPVARQPQLAREVLLERVEQAVTGVLESARADRRMAPDGRLPLLGVATAWPSPVRGSRRAAGNVLSAEWRASHDRLDHAVADRLGIARSRSHALNDANAHALAVAFDDARARAAEPDDRVSRIALYLRIGGGIGAATMVLAPHRRGRLSFLDSVLLGGARSLAGELGHLPVEGEFVAELNARAGWADGLAPLSLDLECSCGQRGHLEALAGGAAWKQRMASSGSDLSGLAAVERAAEHTHSVVAGVQDPRATMALEDIGRLIGRALASPVLLLDPSILTLTGSFAVPQVVDGILAERETWRHVFGDALDVRVHDVPDRRFVGVRGAALAVLRRHVHRRLDEIAVSGPPGDHVVYV